MKFVLDTHSHTIAGGHAYSTVIEMAKVASDKGLELICITEHGPAMPGGPHEYFFGNLRVIPDNIYGVEILKGVEANIMGYDGKLDLSEKYLEKLDVVIASLHEICYPGGSVEENTEAMINAIKNPYVNIIAHPGNPRYPIDQEAVVNAAKKYGKILEINNGTFMGSRKGSYENCLNIARLARDYGVMLSLGSDAHIAFDIGRFDKAYEVIREAEVPEDLIVNTSVEKFKRCLKSRFNEK
ncbi:phosphatase [Caldanaerobius polysaccharolyticus]|uniref:phosphatase n=1 Tax=Caldanaerobius polysaccharolyticus TaxID=44256 RepID=UPI00047B3DEF|nr:phosphatase [Caldanaerobius polysaccharolyticus]